MNVPNPLADFAINVGGTYWAAYGDQRWSAVRVISKGYKHARVERVKPTTQEVVNRKGKCRLDEMVKRDPKLNGKDKPKEPPSEVFRGVRELRARVEEAKAPPEPPEPPPPPRRATASQRSRITHLLDLIDDKSTIDDW